MKMNTDMIEFGQIENVEDDYNLEDFFPNTISYKLQPLIEYRIKSFMKTDANFLTGETQVLNTGCTYVHTSGLQPGCPAFHRTLSL